MDLALGGEKLKFLCLAMKSIFFEGKIVFNIKSMGDDKYLESQYSNSECLLRSFYFLKDKSVYYALMGGIDYKGRREKEK